MLQVAHAEAKNNVKCIEFFGSTGSTGRPKGIVRAHRGYEAWLGITTRAVIALEPARPRTVREPPPPASLRRRCVRGADADQRRAGVARDLSLARRCRAKVNHRTH